ncbi:UNVERIFIED_CONTAM: hypothetical protein H355_013772, partial [Colinus virginianus]
NVKKCKQLLQKAVECSAVPLEMLETALQNFNSLKKQLLSDEEKENFAVSSIQESGLQSIVGNQRNIKRNDSIENSSAVPKLLLGEEKSQELDAIINFHNPLRPLNKSNQACPFGRVPVKLVADIDDAVPEMDVPLTASVMKRQISSSKCTALIPPFPLSEPKPSGSDSCDLTDSKVSASIPSNECIAIKGRVYTILKQIGSGGSSKVFQVLNEKKQLYAVKYVNLEEADQQTVESYKNEIAHLSKLQEHSDKIIRLYSYEITDQHIYMVMECGNIDLNSWLKKKKNIDPLERKSYWKNMLEAVHTIHEHGTLK